ncbi:MAG TPA: VOC family protein [Gaiellaceae bacterium]
MISNRSVPSASVIPELPYPDVREAAEWLCRAFGFRERLQIGDHRAQLVFEDGAVIAIQGDAPGSTVLVRVPDADAHRAQAEAAGAKVLSEPTDWPYGERQYSAEDLGGHHWTFSESIADVDPADWGGTLKD